MVNGKRQTSRYHVTTVSRSRLRFAVEPQGRVLAVSDLPQGFLPLKIVVSRFKDAERFLHSPALC